MHQTLQEGIFEGVDFKHDDGLSKLQVSIKPIKTFLVPNLRSFIFVTNFAIRQIRGCRIPARKYPNKVFLVLNVFFILHGTSHVKNSKVLVSKMAIIFSNSRQIFNEIFFENSKFFPFT